MNEHGLKFLHLIFHNVNYGFVGLMYHLDRLVEFQQKINRLPFREKEKEIDDVNYNSA